MNIQTPTTIGREVYQTMPAASAAHLRADDAIFFATMATPTDFEYFGRLAQR
jgi:hypothetical protein